MLAESGFLWCYVIKAQHLKVKMTDLINPDVVSHLVNLASPRLGTEVAFASDEFFADKARLIDDNEPVFVPGRYDDHGKWMDGWETRRRRGGGFDWCVLRLGVPGDIEYVDIDTRHFTGNYPPAASLDGCAEEGQPGPSSVWHSLVPSSALGPNSQHLFKVSCDRPVRWLRLSIFPDGGVARLRVYGKPVFDPGKGRDSEIELSALKNGGRLLAASDTHYGPPWVILTPGRGRDMGDGWETRRRREPGYDWVIVALGHPGVVRRVEVDTAHFKGNFPDEVSMQAALAPPIPDAAIVTQSMFWATLLPPQKLQADHIHSFGDVAALGSVNHVRINIHPDGGISRLRVFGTLAST